MPQLLPPKQIRVPFVLPFDVRAFQLQDKNKCVILLFLVMPVIECFLSIVNSTNERNQARNTASKVEPEQKSLKTSIYDVLVKRFRKFSECFCIQKNVIKVLDTSTESPLDFINGIRTILMFQVFFSHIGIFYFSAVSYPDDEFEKMIKSPIAQLIFQGPTPPMTFCVLGGFLTSLSFYGDHIKRNGNISFFSFYIRRFLRITPTYMVVLGFYTNLFSYTGSGPLWPNYDTNPICKTAWKWNLLYLNNFQEPHKQCYQSSWFLACAMQLHAVSPLFIIPLLKWPRIGYALTGVCILSSCFFSFVQTVKYDLIMKYTAMVFYLSNLNLFFERFWLHFDIIGDKPHTNVTPFLVGIVFGCYLLNKNFPKARNSNRRSFLYVWISVVILIWSDAIRSVAEEKSSWKMAAYDEIVSLLFYICLSGIIYECCSGEGGYLKDFLSHKYFAPLARVSFSASLINFPVIERYFLSRAEPIQYTSFSMVLLIIYLLFWILAASFIVAVLFEIPLSRLINLFSKKAKE